MTIAISVLREALESVAVVEDVEPMAAYMKNKFEFLGCKSAPRRKAAKPFMAGGKGASSEELIATAKGLWQVPEREFQYVGTDYLRRWSKGLEPDAIDDVAWLITHKSWWDTVDALAAHTVGPLVAAHPDLTTVVDRWIDDDNMWLARSALLYQLAYKDKTDVDRLFRYCLCQRTHKDFFIRKAIGWALREQAKQTPDRVAAFVTDHHFSPLTEREALKHLR